MRGQVTRAEDDQVGSSLTPFLAFVCQVLTRHLAVGETEQFAPKDASLLLKERKMAIGAVSGGYNPMGIAAVNRANTQADAAADLAAQTGSPTDGMAATKARNDAENKTTAEKNKMDSTQRQFKEAIAQSR
jgi:hypothetical protein